MLTAKPQLNLADAREYFREHLAAGDARAEGLKMTGKMDGPGSQEVGAGWGGMISRAQHRLRKFVNLS